MLLIEWILVVIAIIWAFAAPNAGCRLFDPAERGFAKLARKRGTAVFVTGLGALCLRAALLPVLPIPEPGVHDEFSYLLMADTFAHGRLSNPPHPMGVHFETFHVIQKPTYASMYFPAQGVFLAAGQVIFHHPFWGVWISAGLMCGAICWMLQGWLPPVWALLGGMLAVIRLATFSYWANTYFGGNVAALGGALILGALPRINRYQRIKDALLMGVGLALLANSRPFEGLFYAVPILSALFLWVLKTKRDNLKRRLSHVVFPLALTLCVTAIAMLYYFRSVTGSFFRTPYSVNLAAYNPVPYFPWQYVKAWPIYHHEILRRFYSETLLGYYGFVRSHILVSIFLKWIILWCFYLGPLLTVPMLMLGVVLPRGFSFSDASKQTRFFLVLFFIGFLGILIPTYVLANPHYAAPLTAVVYALVISALMRIRHWCWCDKATGVAIVRSVPTMALVLLVIAVITSILNIQGRSMPQTWCSAYHQRWDRPAIEAQLERLPGRQLILVRYSPDHDPRSSWVANAADIDGSKVVWANDMGPQQNQELIDYFKDRKVWVVEPDVIPARLSEYTADSRTTTGRDPSYIRAGGCSYFCVLLAFTPSE